MTDTPKSKKSFQLGGVSHRAKGFRIENVPPDVIIETMEDLSADSPVYVLIGQITAKWAILEHTLNEVVWKLANIPEKIGACFTAQYMNHSQRLDTIIALSHIHGVPTALIAEAKSLKQKLFDAADARNRAVHDPWLEITAWTSDGNSSQVAQFKSMDKKGLNFGPQNIDLKALEETLARVNDRIKDCSKFRSAIFSALQTLRQKQT